MIELSGVCVRRVLSNVICERSKSNTTKRARYFLYMSWHRVRECYLLSPKFTEIFRFTGSLIVPPNYWPSVRAYVNQDSICRTFSILIFRAIPFFYSQETWEIEGLPKNFLICIGAESVEIIVIPRRQIVGGLWCYMPAKFSWAMYRVSV